MKAFTVIVAGVVLLAAGVMRFGLVAQAPAQTKDDVAKSSEMAEKERAMIGAARHTYEAVVDGNALGRLTDEPVYFWSTNLARAEARAADSKEALVNACAEHLKRMQRLRDRVAALARVGAAGGEAEKRFATDFYVAEAELLLLHAKTDGLAASLD